MEYQECCDCGSMDIIKESGAMGVHECRICHSSAIMWVDENEPIDHGDTVDMYGYDGDSAI